MATTIQVQEKTLRFLKAEKKRLRVTTYDEVIGNLAKKKEPLIQNMFGIDRGQVEPFTEKDHLEFHEDL